MPNRRHQGIWVSLFIIVLVFLGSGPRWASAALPKRLLDSLVTSMSKSADEGLQGAQKLFRSMNLDDVKWQKYVDELGTGGLTEAEALAKMRGLLDVTELPPGFSDQLKTLTRVERQTMVSLLEDSKRIFKVGTEQGVKPETIFRAVEQGGPDAVLGLRSMTSPEGMVDCIHGFDRFGDRFAAFAKQGDEGAVRSLMKQADEVSQLKKAQIDDILSNPVKYFDEMGNPTRAFDELVGSVKPVKTGARVTAKQVMAGGIVASVVYALCPDEAFDTLESFLPKSLVDALRSIQWWIRYGLVFLIALAVFYFIWPLLAPVLTIASLSMLKWAQKIPGRMGKMAANKLQVMQERKDTTLNAVGGIAGDIGKEQLLRLGLLGSRRAGKSTFITMLNEKLGKLVPGATLGFANVKDQKELEKVKNDVIQGVPTTEEHEIHLDLTWPYPWQKGGGHWSGLLSLRDYPGEYACSEIDSKDFKGLAEYLRNVDGLFVVIDPTDLELKDLGNRKTSQKKVIDHMFSREGLNLGHAFKRSLAILVTKRDAMDDAWFEKHRPEDMPEEKFREICDLAEKPSLTKEESKQLGHAVLRMLYPNMYDALQIILDPVQGRSNGVRGRLWDLVWPPHPESARIEVFAVSQLGFTAGKRVSKERKKNADPLNPPLDLDNIDEKELDLHYPFEWMFDNIPGGWLNEVNAEVGRKTGWKRFLPWNTRRGTVHSRFRGSPIAQQDRRVSNRRGLAFFLLVFFVICWFSWGADERERKRQEQIAKQTLDVVLADSQATAPDYRDAIEQCRQQPTRPLGDLLDRLTTAIDTRAKMEDIDDEIHRETDLARKLDALGRWFSVYRGYTSLDANPADELQRFQNREKERLLNRVDTYIDTLNKYSTSTPQNEQYKEAYDKAKKAIVEMAQLGDLPHIGTELAQKAKEINSIQTSMRETYVKILLKDEADEIEELIRQERFPEAIRKYDDFSMRHSDDKEVVQQVGQERSRCVDRYWEHLPSVLKELEKKGDFETVEKRLGEFLSLPKLGASGEKAELWRQSLPNKRVEFATNTATEFLVDGKNEEAWNVLNAVQSDLSKAENATRQAWTEKAVEIQKRRGEYAAAIDLLDRHPDPSKKELLLERSWADWTEYLEKAVPEMIAQKKFADARQALKKFADAKFSCPEECQRKIRELRGRCEPELNVAEAVDHAEKSGGQVDEQLLNRLLSFRKTGDLGKLDNEKLRDDWLRTISDAYVALGKSNEAIAFLNSLKSDSVLRFEVEKLDELIRLQQLGSLDAALSEAEKQEEKGDIKQAIRILLNARDRVADLNDTDRRNTWWKRIVELYEKDGDYRGSLTFLIGSQADTRLRLDISDETIENKREMLIVNIDKRFLAMMNEHRDEAAWRVLSKEWNNEMDDSTRQALRKLALAKTEAALKSIETETRKKAEEASDYKNAFKILDDALTMFGELRKLPGFQIEERLENLRTELADKYVKSRIDRVITTQDFPENYTEILSIAKEKPGEQEHRRLDTKQRELLANWEKSLYRRILDAVGEKKFSVFQEWADDYLKSDQPYSAVRPDKRVEAVGALKSWIDQFDTMVDYTIISIRYQNLPAASHPSWSNYDPQIRVTINGNQSTAGEDNIKGAGTLTKITTPKFKWKKGLSVKIGVWQGKLDSKKYCIGTIELTKDYSLLQLALDGAFVPVTLQDYTGNNDFKDAGFGLGLSVTGLKSMPSLPPYEENR